MLVPAADTPAAMPRAVLDSVVIERRYFGSHEMATEPADRPAATLVDGGLQPVRIAKRLALDAGGQFGGASLATFGELALSNVNSRLGDLPARYAIDGRKVVLREGVVRRDAAGRRLMPRIRDMSVRGVALAETWSWAGAELRIQLTDAGAKLAVPLQTTTYGGKGKSDGGPDIRGLTKPLAFGIVRNASPVLLDTFLSLYQIHDGPIRELRVVRDSGVALGQIREAGTLSILLDATIEPGEVSVHLGSGMFRLGSPAAGVVTCDLRGDGADPETIGFSSWDDGTNWDDQTPFVGPGEGVRGYTSQLGSLIRRIAFWVGWESRDLDRAWTTAVNRAFPEPAGVFLPAGGSRSALELIGEAMVSVCGWFEVDRTGALTGGLLRRPGGRGSVSIGPEQIVSSQRLNLPYGRPSWRYRVSYQRNWTPMADSQVADVVREQEPDTAALLTRAARYAETGDQRIRLAFPASQAGVELPSWFDDQAAAQRAAARRLALYHAGASLVETAVRSLGTRVRLGALVSFTDPKLGIHEPRPMIVVGVDDGGARESVLTLFG